MSWWVEIHQAGALSVVQEASSLCGVTALGPKRVLAEGFGGWGNHSNSPAGTNTQVDNLQASC